MNSYTRTQIAQIFDEHGYSYSCDGRDIFLHLPASDGSVELKKIGGVIKAYLAIGYSIGDIPR